jgi:thiopeptide-type bacteriocin biosynthesis protein
MSTEWLFVHLYPGDWTLLDAAIAGVVRPARNEALALGADRWFFIRYIDISGPHLRLRVRGNTDTMNAVHHRWRESLRSQMAVMTRPSSATVDPEVVFRPYEPEYEKYGGPAGVDTAEQAFEACSDAVLDLIDMSATSIRRLALTTLLMRSMPGAVPHLDWTGFWDYHDRFWTRRGSPPPAGSIIPAATDDALRKLESSYASDPAAVALVSRIGDATAAAVMTALATDSGLSAEHLLLHHMHMAVNRLGVLPRQEALLGRRIAMGRSG